MVGAAAEAGPAAAEVAEAEAAAVRGRRRLRRWWRGRRWRGRRRRVGGGGGGGTIGVCVIKTARVENLRARSHACAVDVPVAPAVVLPHEEVVRPVERQLHRALVARRDRDRKPRELAEDGPVRSHACAIHIAAVPSAVQATRKFVPSNATAASPWNTAAICIFIRVENRPVLRDPRPEKIEGVHVLALPDRQELAGPERDRRSYLVARPGCDRDPLRVEDVHAGRHAAAVHVFVAGAVVVPGDEGARLADEDRR